MYLYRDFIKTISDDLNELSQVRDERGWIRFRYHLFILIAIGIEMLGAALDDEGWHEPKLSGKRFNSALEQIMSLQKYLDTDLFNQLRCGMAHVYLPRAGLGINTKEEGGEHLEIKSGVRILHVEDLLEDFTSACDEVIQNIDGQTSSLDLKEKAKGPYLFVGNI